MEWYEIVFLIFGILFVVVLGGAALLMNSPYANASRRNTIIRTSNVETNAWIKSCAVCGHTEFVAGNIEYYWMTESGGGGEQNIYFTRTDGAKLNLVAMQCQRCGAVQPFAEVPVGSVNAETEAQRETASAQN